MRPSITILVFLLALSGVATAFQDSGYADAAGLDFNPGSEDEVNQIESALQDRPNYGGGNLASLFGLVQSGVSALGDIIDFLTIGPAMLKVFLPSWIIDPFIGILYLFMFADLLYVATGREI